MGGTGFSTYNQGDLLYGNGSNSLSTLAIGGENAVLTVAGGLPSWVATSVINFWQRADGAIAQLNLTDDFLLGSTATSSALFGVIDIATGNPIATLSSSVNNNGLSLDSSTSTIQSLLNNTLTIGGDSTGDIVLAGRDGADDSLVLSGYLGGALLTDVNGRVTAGILPISYGGSPFEEANGSIFERITSQDFLLGGVTTTSAQFAVTGINDDSPVATLSGSTNNGISLSADTSTIQSLLNNTLTIGGDSTGNILLSPGNGAAGSILTTNAETVVFSGTSTLTASSLDTITSANTLGISATLLNLGADSPATIGTTNDSNLTLSPNGTGNIVLASDSDTSVLIGSASTPAPLSIAGGIGGNAALIVDQLNSGDIFTASASGVTRFSVTNTGDLVIGDDGSSFFVTLTPNTLDQDRAQYLPNEDGTLCIQGSLACGFALGVNYFQLNNNLLSPINSTYDFAIGGDSTTSASFAVVGVADGAPIATLAASTNNNGIYLDSSTSTIQSLLNNTLTIGGDSTGDIVLAGRDGADDSLVLSGYLGGALLTDVNGRVTAGILPISYGGSPFEEANGSIFERITSQDFLLGGVSTASSKFAFINVNSGIPTASISAGSGNNSLYLAGNGILGTTNAQSLTLGSSSTGSIVLSPNGINRVGIGFSSSPLAALDVRSSLGTLPTASISGNTSFTTLLVDNSGTGSIFAASASGAPRFAITASGDIQFDGGSGYLQTLVSTATDSRFYTFPDATGEVCIDVLGNCAGAGGIVAGTGTQNFIAKFTSTGSTIGDSTIFDDGTGVVIGGSSPIGLFNVVGEIAGKALTVLNYTGGDQNIFTASTAGVTQFSITNVGDINFAGSSPYINTITSSASASRLYEFPDADGVICLTIGNCAGAGGGIVGNGNDNRIARFSGTNSIESGSINDLYTGGVNLTLTENSSFGFNTTSPLATIDARGALSYIPVASFSGNTNAATLVLDNSGSGEIFTASASGVTRFSVTNTGDLVIGDDGSSFFVTLTPNTLDQDRAQYLPNEDGTLCIQGSLACGFALGVNYFQLNNNLLSPINSTYDFAIGGDSTTSASFAVVGVADGAPIATLAASTNNNGIYLDSSTSTIQSLLNNTLTIGGDSTGNILLSPGNGAAGSILTTNAETVNLTNTTTLNGTSLTAINGGATAINFDEFSVDASTGSVTIDDNADAGYLSVDGTVLDINSLTFAGTGDIITTGDATVDSSTNINLDADGGNIILLDNGTEFGRFTNTGTSLVIDSAGTATTIADDLTITGGDITNISLNFGNGSAATLGTVSDDNLTLSPNGTGNLILASDSDTSVLIGSASTPAPLSIAGGIGGNAALIVDQLNSGDIFTASASGVTRFSVTNTGDLVIGDDGSSFFVTLTPNTLDQDRAQYLPNEDGTLCIQGSLACGFALGVNYFQLNNNLLSPINSTYDFAIGGDSTTSASFAVVGVADGAPIATLAASTNNNGIYLDSSTSTIQSLLNNTLTIGGDSTGDIVLAGRNGADDSLVLSGYLGGALLTDVNGRVTAGILPISYGGSPFEEANGSIFERITSQDFLLGGVTTTSAQFAVTGINDDSPVATLSGSTNNGISLSADTSTIQSLLNNTLTIGGDSTGNILLSPGNGAGLLSFNLNELSVNGNLGITEATPQCVTTINGIVTGTGVCQLGAEYWNVSNGAIYTGIPTLDLLLGGSSTTSAKFAILNNSLSRGNQIASLSGDLVLDAIGSLQTTNGQTLTIGGDTTGDIVLSGRDSADDAIVFSGYSAGALQADINGRITSGTLSAAFGGTGFSTYNQGDLLYGNGSSTLSTLGIGGEDAVLSVSGGLPVWTPTSVINFWQRADGAIAQLNLTDDFLLGSTATSSALFGVIDIATGNPIATLSSSINNNGLSLDSSTSTIQSLLNNTLTIGGDSTGDIVLAGRNGADDSLVLSGYLGGALLTDVNGRVTAGILPISYGGSPFEEANGSIFERITSQDFLLGGVTTTSAQFAVTGINDDSPVATLSGSTNNGIYLSADTSTIQSLLNNTLTIGGDSTGNILLSPGNGAAGSILTTNAETVNLTNTTTLNGTSLTAINGGATAINFDEFSVDASTGSVTIDDNADAGYLSVDGTVLDINSLDFVGAGDITTGTDTNLSLTPGGNGLVGIFTSSPLSTLDVRSNSGTLSIASISGSTSNAALLVNQTGVGDIFTASASGVTRFSVTNTGDLVIGDDGSSFFVTLTPNTLDQDRAQYLPNEDGTLCIQGSLACGFALGVNYFQLNNNLLSPINSTYDFAIGGDSTTSASFAVVGVADGAPIATLAASTNNNGIYLDSSTSTIQSLLNNTLTIGGDSTGDIVLAGRNGADDSLVLSGYLGGALLTDVNGRVTAGILPISYGGSPFEEANGSIFERITSQDFLLGGVTTTSAQFAVTGINDDSPVATLSGSTNNGISLSADTSTIQSLLNNTLTIGGDSTGNILLSPGNGAAGSILTTNAETVNLTNTTTLNGTSLTAINGGATAINFDEFSVDASTGSVTIDDNADAGYLSVDGTVLDINSLDFVGAGDITTGTDTNLSLTPGGNGLVGIFTSSPLSTLDVRSNSGTLSIASISGSTSNAALLVNQTGVGDIFTASASGVTRFSVTNTGDLVIGDDGSSFFVTLTPNTLDQDRAQYLPNEDGTLCIQGSLACGFALGVNYFQLNNNLLSPINSTYDFAIGGDSTTSASFAVVGVADGAPIATLAASTNNNGIYLDSSTSTIQSLLNNTLTIGGDSTGDIVLAGRSGSR